MKHLLVLLSLLLAALAFYSIAGITGAAILLAIGVCFELSFWYRLIKERRQRAARRPTRLRRPLAD